MPDAEGRQRLADVLRRERRQHGPIRNVDFIAKSGLSKSTIDNVVNGRSPGGLSEYTLQGIDRAMGWVPGTAQAITESGGARVAYLADDDRQLAEWIDLFRNGTPGQRRLALDTVRGIFRSDL